MADRTFFYNSSSPGQFLSHINSSNNKLIAVCPKSANINYIFWSTKMFGSKVDFRCLRYSFYVNKVAIDNSINIIQVHWNVHYFIIVFLFVCVYFWLCMLYLCQRCSLQFLLNTSANQKFLELGQSVHSDRDYMISMQTHQTTNITSRECYERKMVYLKVWGTPSTVICQSL